MDYTKPLPQIDNWNRPFWAAARRHELSYPACRACGHAFLPPGPICPVCQSRELDWKIASGRATVESWVVFHQNYFKGFKDDIPYNVALVRLAEGPMLMTNVEGIDNAALHRGLAVTVSFRDATDAVTIPVFRAAEGTA
jgi:uncharacterized OB-fold protein